MPVGARSWRASRAVWASQLALAAGASALLLAAPASAADAPVALPSAPAATTATSPSVAPAAPSLELSVPELSTQEPSALAPAKFRPIRAVLEFGTVFLIGSAYYITTSTKVPNWELNYEWDVFRKKISGEAFIADTNQFGTNFIGHPLGGSGYYLASRSNNGSVVQSTLFAVFGSLLWELFGEIGSDVSVNDSIVTPLAGVAIGESTYQLGSFFDRSSGTAAHRALGVLFGPFKSANDWFDARADQRSRSRYPENEQHTFDLGFGLGSERELEGERRRFDTFRVHMAERLVRFAPYTTLGSESRWFDDGNASGIGLDLQVADRGLHDLRVETSAVLAGHSHRHVVPGRTGPWGGGGLIGLGSGFFYSIHDYLRGAGPKDRIGGVHPLDAVFYHRLSLGQFELTSDAEIGPEFVGSRSLAFDVSEPSSVSNPEGLPLVMRVQQYYFGAGVRGRARLTLGWRRLELGAETRLQTFGATDAPGETLDVRLTDSERHSTGTLSFAPTEALRLRLFAEQRSRSGGLEQISLERRQTALGIAMGVTL